MAGTTKHRRIILIQVIGALCVMATIVFTTLWMSLGARDVADRAADKVGEFYLQELAGHRSQVIAGSIESRFEQMRKAMDLIASENIATQDELRAYIAKIEDLYDLDQFAIVDGDDVVYARYATYMGGSRYDFLSDGSLESGEVMSSTSLYGAHKQVCLAIPVVGLSIEGRPIKACFVQVDIGNVVQTLSTGTRQDTSTSFCIYHHNGENLAQLDFGPIDARQNLLSAMKANLSEEDWAAFDNSFGTGQRGQINFDYEGVEETLYYEPIPESNWMLTVLVADNLIQEQIRGVGDEMLMRSTVQIVVTGLAMVALFGILIYEVRKEKDAELAVERQHSEEATDRAEKSEQELGTVREVAYKDVLTGVNSRYAFLKEEVAVDERIQAGSLESTAVVVCDVNDLKLVNDTQGHAMGDAYIKGACKIICELYSHSPVYRIGGDEFVVLLRGRDYDRRNELRSEFDRRAEENLSTGEVVIASGMAEYQPQDSCLHDVLMRADKRMYDRKAELKKAQEARG